MKLLTTALVLLTLASVTADDALTVEQGLKKQVFLLKMENAQLKARLQDREQRLQAMEAVFRQQVEQAFAKDSEALSAECKKLEAEFRAQLKPSTEATFDCQTLEFKP